MSERERERSRQASLCNLHHLAQGKAVGLREVLRGHEEHGHMPTRPYLCGGGGRRERDGRNARRPVIKLM